MVVILLFVPSSSSLTTSTTSTYTTAYPSAHTKYRIVNSNSCTEQQSPPTRPPLPAHYHYGFHSKQFPTTSTSSYLPDANNNNNNKTNRNYTKEFVNHITRINISNDYSQIDGNVNSDGLPEAVTKEGKKLLLFYTLTCYFIHYYFLIFFFKLTKHKTIEVIFLNTTHIWTTTFQQRP